MFTQKYFFAMSHVTVLVHFRSELMDLNIKWE